MVFTEEYFKILIPAVIAIIVAFLSHQFAKTRELNEERRKHKIDYLLKAYTSLMIHANNPNELERTLALRDAVLTIQIYGSKWQVKELDNILKLIMAGETAELDPILNNLRDELREKLSLGKVEGNIYWVHPSLSLLEKLNQKTKL